MAKVNLKNLKRGDVVQLTERDGRVIACVVASIRYIQRGRRAGMKEYKLAPIEKPKGSTYAYKVVGERHLKVPRKKYTAKQIKAALGKEDATRTKVNARKEERVERGRNALTDITVGDEVFVRYSNALPRWEKVLVVNYKTGKIGIPNPRAPQSDEDDFWRQVAALTRGRRSRSRGPKPHRWIHPDSISGVRSQQKKCPCKITARIKKALASKGWFQVRYGSEFIESSYVVGKTKRDAGKGSTFDTVDNTIYQDPKSGLYWRDTGCFD